MSNTDSPKPIAVFLCERILRDVLPPHNISAININNQMLAVSFPATVPLIFALAVVTGSHKPFEYQFRFIDKSGKAIAESAKQMVEPLPNTNYTHTLVGAFQGLRIEEEGTYTLSLILADEVVSSMNFHVIHIVPETVA